MLHFFQKTQCQLPLRQATDHSLQARSAAMNIFRRVKRVRHDKMKSMNLDIVTWTHFQIREACPWHNLGIYSNDMQSILMCIALFYGDKGLYRSLQLAGHGAVSYLRKVFHIKSSFCEIQYQGIARVLVKVFDSTVSPIRRPFAMTKTLSSKSKVSRQKWPSVTHALMAAL